MVARVGSPTHWARPQGYVFSGVESLQGSGAVAQLGEPTLGARQVLGRHLREEVLHRVVQRLVRIPARGSPARARPSRHPGRRSARRYPLPAGPASASCRGTSPSAPAASPPARSPSRAGAAAALLRPSAAPAGRRSPPCDMFTPIRWRPYSSPRVSALTNASAASRASTKDMPPPGMAGISRLRNFTTVHVDDSRSSPGPISRLGLSTTSGMECLRQYSSVSFSS